MHACMHTYIQQTHTHTYIHACMHTYMQHTYVRTCHACMHACIHIHRYIHPSIHTYIHRSMDTNKHSGRGAHDVPSVCKMEGEDGHGLFHDLDTGELRSFLALPKKWDTLALAAEESRDFKLSPRAHGDDVIPTLQNMGQVM